MKKLWTSSFSEKLSFKQLFILLDLIADKIRGIFLKSFDE
jgi:hypothetical protein